MYLAHGVADDGSAAGSCRTYSTIEEVPIYTRWSPNWANAMTVSSNDIDSIFPSLDQGHKHVLQEIYIAFRDRGSWPKFAHVDRQLRREDYDLAELLDKLDPYYLHRDSFGPYTRPDEQLRLTVAGLRKCEGTEREIHLFLRAVHWMSIREEEYDPPEDGPVEPVITSAEAVEVLGLPRNTRGQDLALLRDLLLLESPLWTSASGEPTAWSFTLSRDLSKFRRIEEIEDYLWTKVQLLGIEREFKWHHGPIEGAPTNPPDPDQYYCPYCGQPAATDEWWTPEQVEVIQAATAQKVIPQLQDELQDSFRELNRSGMLKASIEADLPNPPPPLFEDDDMMAVASPCHPYEPVKVEEEWSAPLYCLICGAAYVV
jgi:hypothetical protein